MKEGSLIMLYNDSEMRLQEVLSDPESTSKFQFCELIILKTKRTEPYTKEEINNHIYVGNDGVLEIWSDWELDFRKDADCHYLPYDKWLILVARYADHSDKIEELKQIATEIFDNCETVEIRQDALRENHFRGPEKYVLSDFFDWSEKSMKEFIMDPSYVVIKNENRMFQKLLEAGLLNASYMEDYMDSNSFEED